MHGLASQGNFMELQSNYGCSVVVLIDHTQKCQIVDVKIASLDLPPCLWFIPKSPSPACGFHEPRARPRSTLATLASWTSFSRLLVTVGSDLPAGHATDQENHIHNYSPSGNQTWQCKNCFFLIGKSPINGPYFIAMFDHRMVYRSVAHQ